MNDDELLAHMRAADPALTSKAPQPDINSLVEAAMTMNTPTPSANSPAQVTTLLVGKATGGGLRRWLVLAGAAAVLVAGGGITWGAMTYGGEPSSPAPLALTLQSGPANTKCAPLPTVEDLRGYPTAFEGTVTSQRGNRVELRVDHWFRGKEAPTVQLSRDENVPEGLALEVGESYLMTAEKGIVPACVGTSPANDETRSLFREAFEK